MAAIVQRLERQIVVLDVVGSIPTSRPITLRHITRSGYLSSIMRALISTLIVTAVAFGALGQDTRRPDVKHQPRARFVTDEILVKFAPVVSERAASEANRSLGASKLEDLGDTGWQRVRVPDGMSVAEAMQHYQAIYGVDGVQPNYYYKPDAVANDEFFANLYGLTKISAPAAWDLTTGSSSVVVAVLDTGTRYTHPDLVNNIWTNPGEFPNNGVDDDANGFVDDYYGWDIRFNDSDPIDLDSGISGSHGTHTAGTIGAVGNNLVGVTGVNWNVKIMTIKIFNNTVWDDTTSAMLINAYNYVRMMKNRGINIKVTNNSYGGCTEACGYDPATRDAIDALGDAGVLNVFSAGNNAANSDTSPQYPAAFESPSIVSVAASDSTDAKAPFSNYGLVAVDIAAPGVGIQSTVPPTSYSFSSGTSMAGPHVAGAAALLAAYNPSLSAASLKASLLNSVDVLGPWAGIVKTGGRLNVDRALRNQTVCSFNAGASQFNIVPRGGIITLNIGAPTNCDYAVKSDLKWVTVLDNAPKSGSSTVRIRVSLSRTALRTGTIKIGDQTVTIRQARYGT